MASKKHIRKILFTLLWLVAGAGTLVLLVASIKSRNDKLCSGYEIEIVGGGDHWFMDKNDVVQVLTNNGAYKLKGRPIKNFDLRRLEDKLSKDVWIREAELFFDNNNLLRVKIEEREPIARIFTVNNNSFYVDSAGEQLPLSDKFSARLPVFTGFPSDKPKRNGPDSALLRQVKEVSNYLLKHPFWMAQIAQVDITPDKRFEMMPTIGNHIIEFGNGMDADKKFGRLMTFYKEVLSKTGMNIYEKINVQYDKQVIGVRRGAATSRFDSLQAARRLEMLIASGQNVQQQLPPATDTTNISGSGSRSMVMNSPAKTNANTEKPPIKTQTVPKRTNTLQKKIQPVKNRSYENAAKPANNSNADKPKAVMPKRGVQ